MSDRPNIVFILTDQQHHAMMSCAGNAFVQTPAMDRLASRGVRFDRAYCANPVCSASRFSLFTGRFPSAIGMYSNFVPPDTVVPPHFKDQGLGHLMRRAGYDAVYGGKTHFPKMKAPDLGFDYFCPNERDELADACADFLTKKRDKPFFLVCSLINPHDICYMAIRDFAETQQERRLVEHGKTECATLDQALARPPGVSNEEFFARHCPPLPPNYEPQQDEPGAIQALLESRPFRLKARQHWSDERWREQRWAYARLTERVDRQVAKVVDALDHGPHAQNTIVVFTSDHGDMDGSHRLEHKSALYDQSSRIPLIIRPAGGITPRVDTTHMVSNGLDLLPTFCDWAGVAPPTDLIGRSLKPLVDGASASPWREAVPIESAIGRAVVTERFKYVRHLPGVHAEQLYDLVSDPHETRNAALDPKHQEAIKQLRTVFDEIFAGPAATIPDLPTMLTQS